MTFEPIERHKYPDVIVRLSTTLYSRVNCGFRQVVEILDVFNDVFGGLLGEIPCHNSIENWTKKCGLNVYKTSEDSLKDMEYAQIVDESMMIGSEKLLLTLGVPAEHHGSPLNYEDVSILDIGVAESWNGEEVADRLTASAQKVGHPPKYVISDNASVMNKGVRCTGFNHHRDISHTLGMILERVYKKEEDFKEYVKLMTEPKFKHNMKKIAYLLPPRQRTIARFMNLSEWVKWSAKMLEQYHTLKTKEDRAIFSFIPANASLIDELSDVVKCVNSIEHICKHKGLSKETVDGCLAEIRKYLFTGNRRMIQIGAAITMYLLDETKTMTDNESHNNSSDIIESIFGKYKSRKSPNKLHGITPFILFLPIQARLLAKSSAKGFNFKEALETVYLKEVDEWSKDKLTKNLVQMRTKFLKNSA